MVVTLNVVGDAQDRLLQTLEYTYLLVRVAATFPFSPRLSS